MSRQCGGRVAGGIYACVPTSPFGRPIEEFLLCPAHPVDKDALGLSSIGVKLIPRHDDEAKCRFCLGTGEQSKVNALLGDGGDPLLAVAEDGAREPEQCPRCVGTGKRTVFHVFDIVGAEYYPNVSDFVEETRMLGVSRRCELQAEQYALITKESRLILLHPKALIENAGPYYDLMRDAEKLFQTSEGKAFNCPHYRADHTLLSMAEHGFQTCSGLWRHDIEPGDQTFPFNDEAFTEPQEGERRVRRVLACGAEYEGWLRGEEVDPKHRLGIFATFPLSHFETVDPEGEHADKFTRLEHCELGFVTCDE